MFLRRKSEFRTDCGSGILVNIRAENGIHSQWRDLNQSFFMADIENVTPSETLRIGFSRKREYYGCEKDFLNSR